MALDHVRAEIVEQARRESAKLAQAAAKEAAAILGAAEQKLTEFAMEAEAEHAQLREAMAKQEIAGARFEAKKVLLNARKAVLDRVFQQLTEKLSALPEGKREELLATLLARAGKEITVHTVHAHSRDVHLLSKRKGLFVKPADIIGGLIAETADGRMRVDYSFDQLLQQLREQELAMIARELF